MQPGPIGRVVIDDQQMERVALRQNGRFEAGKVLPLVIGRDDPARRRRRRPAPRCRSEKSIDAEGPASARAPLPARVR